MAGAEINSSFHRPHRPATYARWAASVPPRFRFSVKMPKVITHTARLVDADELLETFLFEIAGLGNRLSVLLIQLPPSLLFDPAVAERFLVSLRSRTAVALACEPRHPSWFGDAADGILAAHEVARVAAHPVLAPGGERPGGWPGLRYHRLHGAPRIYRSAYEPAFLRTLADRLCDDDVPTWCVFDNTASGAALADALTLRTMWDC